MRIQAIITELVFEHALRVRMKAETSDTSAATPSAASTAVATPDSASQIGTDQGDEDSTEGTAEHSATASSSTAVPPSAASSIKGKGKASPENKSPAKKEAEPAKADEKRGNKHLVGKINNLVSSDLSNFENLGMFTVFISTSSLSRANVCMTLIMV